METQDKIQNKINKLISSSKKSGIFKELIFKKDLKTFNIKDGKGYFSEQSGKGFDEGSTDVLVNKVKLFIKKVPWVFSAIYKIMNPSFAPWNAGRVVSSLPSGVIINLGSGVTDLGPRVINIDFYPFENVDFVADISNLPFADNSVNGIISECVLEHVPEPIKVVGEMHRVLKKNGVVYVIVPFVFSFHSSPFDYYRWSKMGLTELFKDFKQVDCGIHFGPGHAISWVLSEYFSTLFSFNSKKLHQILFMIFLVLSTPLSYLDWILNRFSTSQNIASHIYYVGRKK